MTFFQFSKFLERLEATSSRREITKILSQLLKELAPDEIEAGVFLSLGDLGPRYDNPDTGISEKMMVRILARAYDVSQLEALRLFKSRGDLGQVAQELSEKFKVESSKLKVKEVFDRLLEAAGAGGTGSQERKIVLLSNLVKELDPVSCRFVVRVPLGTMRLGFSEKTILEALTLLESGEKEVSFARGGDSRAVKQVLEEKFAVYPNIGEIAKVTTKKGITGLSNIKLRVGVPVSSMLCGRLNGAKEMVEKMGRIAAEPKYDGARLQIHLDRGAKVKSEKTSTRARVEGLKVKSLMFEGFGKGDEKVLMFTRNFEQMQSVFPDVVEAILREVKARQTILDCEVIGYDPKTGKYLPFQETIQRKRKYDVAEMSKKIPVKCVVFDILSKDGRDLTGLPLRQRREILLGTVEGRTLGHRRSSPTSVGDSGSLIRRLPESGNRSLSERRIFVTEQLVTDDPDKLQRYFKKARKKGFEGLVVKKVERRYEAGNRGFNWVKYKREEGPEGKDGGEGKLKLTDTIDCIVLGYYKGTGKRTGFGIGAFLTGIYDEKNDKILTVAKVGTGLTDEEWRELKVKSEKLKVKSLLKDIEIRKELMPEVICQPKIVVAVRADEITVSPMHSSGFALRFPRMMGYRSDKSFKEATTLKEVEALYKLQKKR